MKNILLLFFLIFTSFRALAQDDITITLQNYLLLSEKKDTEKLMDYIYPKFFDLFPRQMMLETLNKSMNDPTLEISLKDSKILEISPSKTIDTVTYSIVHYSFVMSLKYLESEDNPLPDEEAIKFTQGIFNKMYGEENVTYDKEKMQFVMKLQKEMLVLKTPSLDAWKVLGLEPNLKPLLVKILPSEIVEQL